MAVEVFRTHELPNTVTHEEGQTIEVNEGHMYVRRSPASAQQKGKVIAIYAPEAWREARVVQQTQG